MTCLVMTLLVRDESDILRDNIEFHLNHGVDLIVATDNGSTDGTREILAEFERLGLVHLLDEPMQDFSQGKWVTRMALLARDRFQADWILNNDADEFWYPASGDLKTGLQKVSSNMFLCQRRNMVFPCDRPRRRSWQTDLVYRVSEPTPVPKLADRQNSPLPQLFFYLKLPPKALCRADGLLAVKQGNHEAVYETASPKESTNILIYHFPIRSREQFVRKVEQGGAAYERNTELSPTVGWHWRRWYRKAKRGDVEAALREALPSEVRIRSDLRNGKVVVDTTIMEAFESGFLRHFRESSPAEIDDGTEETDPKIVDAFSRFILNHLSPSSVIHFSCGTGAIISALQRNGKRVIGVGRPADSCDAVLDDVKAACVFRDLRLPVFVGRADLGMCLDSGACPDGDWADTLADTMARASNRYLIFGGLDAARQKQSIAEKESPASWLQRFESRGFGVDGKMTAMLNAELAKASTNSDPQEDSHVVFTRRH